MINLHRGLRLTLVTAGLLAGCQSSIIPMASPLEESATTQASTQASTQAATQAFSPADKDQVFVSRWILRGQYDLIWNQSRELLTTMGFRLDRQDYREGIITTLPRQSPQIAEFWRPDQAGCSAALENTMHVQRRVVTIRIERQESRPHDYLIRVQALVERQHNPSESLAAPASAGYGRGAMALTSDYAEPTAEATFWTLVGQDPRLSQKILDQLFKRI